MRKQKKNTVFGMEHFFLVLIILVGFGLRLICAVVNPLWGDEADTFFNGCSTLKNLFLGVIDPPHGFLYYFLIKLLIPFNTSVLFLRIPSLIFSLLNIFLVYKIAKLLNFNKFFGLMAAFLMAISPYQIEYSWWARMYEMVLFFVLLSLFSLQRYFISRKIGWGCLFTLSNILGFYTDYSFFWYLLILNLFAFAFFFRNHKDIIGYLLVSNIAVLLYTPVLFKNFPIILDWVAWIERPNFDTLKSAISWLFGFKSFWDRSTSNTSFLFIGLLLILGFEMALKDKKWLFFLLVIFMSFSLPLTISYVASHIFRSSFFLGQNFISFSIILPIFLMSYVTSSLLEDKKLYFQREKRAKGVCFKFLGAFIMCFIFYLNFKLYLYQTSGIFFPRGNERFYKEVAELARSESGADNDSFVLIDNFMSGIFEYYRKGFSENQGEGCNQYINFLSRNEMPGEKVGNLWIIVPPEIDAYNPPEEIKDNPIRFKNNSYLNFIKNKNIPFYKIPNVYKVKYNDFFYE